MKRTFGNSAFYLYLETILNLALGYVFWMIISIVLGASKTGESSASITFATILATISTVGIPVGIQRFLGQARGQNKIDTFNSISKFAVVFTVVIMAISSGIVFVLGDTLVHVFGISSHMITIIVISSVSYALVLSLRGIIVSASNTRVLIVILLIGSIVRFLTIIPIYFYNLGAEGIVLSYTTTYLAAVILLIYATRNNIFKGKLAPELGIKLEIFKSSFSGWIPNIVSLIGTQSGLLFIFGLKGSYEAGIYFIAFSIFSAISALPMSIIAMAYPIMSGMKEGREKLLWRGTKMALFSVIPFAVVIALYPGSVLSVFGSQFTPGQLILSLLILSLVPIEVNRAVSNLAYAYGKYAQVLTLGIFPSIIRIVAYIMLAPLYGSTGTAFAFFIGSFAGLVIAGAVNKKNYYAFPTKDIFAITGIPSIIGLMFYLIQLDQWLSSVLIIVTSYVALARLKIVRYAEVENTINSVFLRPNTVSQRLLHVAKSVFL